MCRKHYLNFSWLFGASDSTKEAEAQVFEQHLFLHGGNSRGLQAGASGMSCLAQEQAAVPALGAAPAVLWGPAAVLGLGRGSGVLNGAEDGVCCQVLDSGCSAGTVWEQLCSGEGWLAGPCRRVGATAETPMSFKSHC